jgi:hypothetical protein
VASAGYVGESFLQIPDLPGGWQGDNYKDWIKFEAREWIETPTCAPRQTNPNALVCDERFYQSRESHLFFSAPWAPPSGPGKLAVTLDKRSPALKKMMELCGRKERIPEATYAESSEMSRMLGEVGRRTPDIPEFFEYRLKEVQLSCPVVAVAPEQVLVLSFADISWLNIEGEGKLPVIAEPAKLPPRPTNGQSRTFLLTWIAPSGSFNPTECAALNKEPTEADYFALWPKDAVSKGKADLAKKGGLATLFAGVSLRGPDRLNVCALPGSVADPGHAAPQTDVARGFNLDGYDGTGELPPNVHRHKNFVSEDGTKGIDNQLYVVEGCVPGFRPEGNIPKVSNEMMRTGALTVLLDISGIDDLQNDDDVAITVLYGKDLMVKSADGSQILGNYTFRISDDPEWTQFFTRFQGRIENGVVLTDPLEEMTFQDGGQRAWKLYQAQMRIELLPDDKIKAVIGGYHDWRARATNWLRSRFLEPTMRFQCPGIYNAYKRAADGLWDPVSGQYKGISVAYDVDGVRAFLPPSQVAALSAQQRSDPLPKR